MERTKELDSKTQKEIQEFAAQSPIVKELIKHCDNLLVIDDTNNVPAILLLDAYFDDEVLGGNYIASKNVVDIEIDNYESATDAYFDKDIVDDADVSEEGFLKWHKAYFIEFIFANIKNKLEELTDDLATQFD